LTATLRLVPWGRGGAHVTGAIHGELTQVCIVSVEPFPATVDEDVDVRFAPPPNRGSSAEQEVQTFSLADEDEPDPVIDGKIDLGALAAEFFALGLDPYPRKPGAILDEEHANSEPADSPFAALVQGVKPGRE
jgi:uncharacterized metal-binding protein YceD (DUF177 family)